MTFRLALRSFAAQPVRSLVLAGGFGVGIASMAGLLGVGEVILEQSRSPALAGGGDVMARGVSGTLHSARFLTSSIQRQEPFASRTRTASPTKASTLYLVRADGTRHAVQARGGVPSLERAMGDPETSAVQGWQDNESDRAWADPDPGDLLRALDRFHPIPDVPARADSWAEWLYFNGRTAEGTHFYLSFIVGRRTANDRRASIVRLQLEREGRRTQYSDRQEISADEVLAQAPDLEIGGSRVRLDGTTYRIHLELYEEQGTGEPSAPPAAPDLVGNLALDAGSGRALPPLTVHGAGGWISGYVVPVLSGPFSGILEIDDARIEFTEAAGYHDHNWGFWEGVTWQWGQVAGDELSLVYGKIRPPSDAADPERIPGFLLVVGPDGPLGHAAGVRIEEIPGPTPDSPGGFEVTARGADLSIEITLDVEEATRTPYRPGGDGGQMEFLQMRARCRVEGRVAGREISFSAPGSAETFRGR